MSHEERRDVLQMSLDNARWFLKTEIEISQGKSWTEKRIQAAKEAIPQWEKRIEELKTILKKAADLR